jgi:predicted amidohydrolase
VGDRLANAASVLGRGGVIAHYRKAHLPYLGVDRWVEPGCDPFAVHEVGGLRVGLLICYDASFPEAARLLALAGADLVLLPTNWPEEAVAKADWLPNTRAYENVIYFAAVNRVGEERGYRFHGRSRICGPAGETLAQGPDDAGAILLADIDPRRSRQKKIVRREGEYWVDRIGQRRTDLYRLAGEGPPEGGRASRPEAADPPDRHPGGPDAAGPDLPREPAA